MPFVGNIVAGWKKNKGMGVKGNETESTSSGSKKGLARNGAMSGGGAKAIVASPIFCAADGD